MNTIQLIENLKNIPIGYASIREIIQVIHEKKIARLSLNDAELFAASKIFDSLGLPYFLSDRKYLSKEDTGKGGFSNSFYGTVGLNVPVGSFLVYIGWNKEQVAEARFAETSGDNSLLGKYLGYPKCCIHAFTRAQPESAVAQNDFTLPILKKNNRELSYDPFSIHLPMYFGYGLFSHFPCSTNCSSTSSMSHQTLKTLSQVDNTLAGNFSRYQSASYLYTEFDGIFAFFERTYCKNGLWLYDSGKMEMSTSGLLAENLKRGNQIVIKTPSNFTILWDGNVIVDIKSETVHLMFHEGFPK